MKKFIITLVALISYTSSFSDVFIKLRIKKYDTLSFSYYKPFEGFANDHIRSYRNLKASGDFFFNFRSESPTFIRMSFDNEVLELLCEPKDTITLEVNKPFSNQDNWLIVKGKNAKGHMYYNNTYNRIRQNKFYDMSDAFLPYYKEDVELIFSKVKNEILKNLNWIDRLAEKGDVTPVFVDYMKLNISSVLAWEVGELSNKHYNYLNPELSHKGALLMKLLFDLVNPMDSRLRYCLASSYYNTYFRELNKTNAISDTTKIIVSDTPFYALAPTDLQSFLWGQSLHAHYLYDPDVIENCKAFKRYKAAFPEGPFIDFLENGNICREPEKNDIKFIKTLDSDFFTFLQFNFFGKRVFIDLWATWCAPCRSEFVSYNSSFRDFMKDHKVELVFISIDNPEHKTRWETDVKKINLSGKHIFAGKALQKSIKEVVFDDKSMVIPRYILVDEDGKILSVDFKRPSDPNFKGEINKLFR